MTARNTRQSNYTRTALQLSGTISRVQAALDHQATVAVAYAQRWLEFGPGRLGVSVQPSGVVRRALQLYARHLSDPLLDPEEEARAVRRCCSSLAADEATQKATKARLAAADSPTSFPSFRDVLEGHDADQKRAEFDARYQATLDLIAKTSWGRLRGFKSHG